jgi:hypothetical protein
MGLHVKTRAKNLKIKTIRFYIISKLIVSRITKLVAFVGCQLLRVLVKKLFFFSLVPFPERSVTGLCVTQKNIIFFFFFFSKPIKSFVVNLFFPYFPVLAFLFSFSTQRNNFINDAFFNHPCFCQAHSNGFSCLYLYLERCSHG